jgi:hypothetical protein
MVVATGVGNRMSVHYLRTPISLYFSRAILSCCPRSLDAINNSASLEFNHLFCSYNFISLWMFMVVAWVHYLRTPPDFGPFTIGGRRFKKLLKSWECGQKVNPGSNHLMIQLHVYLALNINVNAICQRGKHCTPQLRPTIKNLKRFLFCRVSCKNERLLSEPGFSWIFFTSSLALISGIVASCLEELSFKMIHIFKALRRQLLLTPNWP